MIGYSITLNDDQIGQNFFIMRNESAAPNAELTEAMTARVECDLLRAAYHPIMGDPFGNPATFPSESICRKMSGGDLQLLHVYGFNHTSDLPNPCMLTVLSASEGNDQREWQVLRSHVLRSKKVFHRNATSLRQKRKGSFSPERLAS